MAPRSRTTQTTTEETPAKPSTRTRKTPAAPRNRRAAAAAPAEPAPPRPTRARRGAGITVESDEQKFSTPAPDPAPAAQTEASSPGPAPRMPAGKKPWEKELDERKTAISVRLPVGLKARIDGLCDYLALTDPDKLATLLKDCRSQTDVFNHALNLLLTKAEDESNGGKPFPVLIRRTR